ncbi:MAG: hypothetical protein ACK496_15320, partial [Acidobacteriota bacterium]
MRAGVWMGNDRQGRLAIVFVLLTLSQPFLVFAQSGRVPTPPKPKPKPVSPTYPTGPTGPTGPIGRLPESRPAAPPASPPEPRTEPAKAPGDHEDTIRIASDLVTVVTTISTNSAIDPP